MKDLRLYGHRLEHAWHGPPPDAAPTIVFLHEGLGCVSAWRDFPERVAAETGCGVLVYSRAGYGGSDPIELPRPVRYMHDEALTVLPEVLCASGVRSAILLGHSDGASIAIISAGSHPMTQVLGLALLAPHVFVEDAAVRSIAAVADLYRTTDLRERLERRHTHVDVAFWGWNRVWLDPAFRAWNIEEYLPKIHVPVLVVQGVDDEYGTLGQVEAIERGLAGRVERVVLEACGHAPQRDRPEETLSAIVRFVRALLR